MADQYSWEIANQAGYKTGSADDIAGNIGQFSRKTIADGDLFGDKIIETFSSRDDYLLDSLNDIDASARSVYNTVQSNSANFADSAISGFNEINVSSNDQYTASYHFKSYAHDILNFNIAGLDVSTEDTSNKSTIKISASDALTGSYFDKAKRGSLSKDNATRMTVFGVYPATSNYDMRGWYGMYFNSKPSWGGGLSFLLETSSYKNRRDGINIFSNTEAQLNGIGLYGAISVKGIAVDDVVLNKDSLSYAKEGGICFRSQYQDGGRGSLLDNHHKYKKNIAISNDTTNSVYINSGVCTNLHNIYLNNNTVAAQNYRCLVCNNTNFTETTRGNADYNIILNNDTLTYSVDANRYDCAFIVNNSAADLYGAYYTPGIHINNTTYRFSTMQEITIHIGNSDSRHMGCQGTILLCNSALYNPGNYGQFSYLFGNKRVQNGSDYILTANTSIIQNDRGTTHYYAEYSILSQNNVPVENTNTIAVNNCILLNNDIIHHAAGATARNSVYIGCNHLNIRGDDNTRIFCDVIPSTTYDSNEYISSGLLIDVTQYGNYERKLEKCFALKCVMENGSIGGGDISNSILINADPMRNINTHGGGGGQDVQIGRGSFLYQSDHVAGQNSISVFNSSAWVASIAAYNSYTNYKYTLSMFDSKVENYGGNSNIAMWNSTIHESNASDPAEIALWGNKVIIKSNGFINGVKLLQRNQLNGSFPNFGMTVEQDVTYII